jgi:hypothetical protein
VTGPSRRTRKKPRGWVELVSVRTLRLLISAVTAVVFTLETSQKWLN